METPPKVAFNEWLSSDMDNKRRGRGGGGSDRHFLVVLMDSIGNIKLPNYRSSDRISLDGRWMENGWMIRAPWMEAWKQRQGRLVLKAENRR